MEPVGLPSFEMEQSMTFRATTVKKHGQSAHLECENKAKLFRENDIYDNVLAELHGFIGLSTLKHTRDPNSAHNTYYIDTSIHSSENAV